MAVTAVFFPAFNHNHDDIKWSFEKINKQNRSKSTNHNPETPLLDLLKWWLTAAKKEPLLE